MADYMKKNNDGRFSTIAVTLILFFLLGGAGCAKRVMLEIEANRDLNMDLNEPHTLELLIFQLKNEKDFDASWENYLSSNYDRSKILGDPIRKIVLPGSVSEITIAREKEAKFIGVVAGYYKPRVPLKVRQVVSLKEGSHITLVLGPYGIIDIQQ